MSGAIRRNVEFPTRENETAPSTTTIESPEPIHEPRSTRSMKEVMRALKRATSRALIFEHLARLVGRDFMDTPAGKARLRLQLQDGSPCQPEVDDVFEIEQELVAMASEERRKSATIRAARVPIDPAVVDHYETKRGPFVAAPVGEAIVTAPTARPSGNVAKAGGQEQVAVLEVERTVRRAH